MAELDTLREIRTKYPTPLGARHAAFLLESAAALGMGLYLKPSGSNVALPDGTLVSMDILIKSKGGAGYDVLKDADGAAEVTFDLSGPDSDPARFYAVVPSVPDVPHPPVPTPVPVDLTPVLQKLEQVAQGVAAVSAAVAQAAELQQLAYKDIVAHIEDLKQQPHPALEGSLFGFKLTLTPKA